MKIVNQKQQEKQITNSLKFLVDILNGRSSEYRIIGSVLLVAYKNKIFRHIGDVDILLDNSSKSFVFDKLEKDGFLFNNRHWGGFNWVEVEKENYLTLTFFLVGDFMEHYFRYTLFDGIELRIDAAYLQPTQYHFNGVTFTGIPLRSAIAGIHQAFLNPKRRLDKAILKEEIRTLKVRKYGNINVYVKGMLIPYLYDIFSFFYNVYGGIRVRFGKKYEAWD